MQKHSGKSDSDLSIAQRSKMLTSLWATVSTLYYVDKICKAETELLGKVYRRSGLQIFAEAAANLRNARDHIGQRVANIASRKSLPPINGVVRWTFNPRVEGQEYVFNIQLFTIDPMLKRFSIPSAEGIDKKITKNVDHLALFAFDGCLQVSRAEEALTNFLEKLGAALTAAISDVGKLSAPKGTEMSGGQYRPFCAIIEARGRN